MWKPAKRSIQAWGALYGNGIPPKSRKRKSIDTPKIPTEEMEQIWLVDWMAEKGIRYYAIPNGRKDAAEGARYKRMGAISGVPDICVPVPRSPYHGLYIELKRTKGGVLSAEQKEWLEWLTAHGYKAVCVKGFEEAKKVVEEYLQWKRF